MEVDAAYKVDFSGALHNVMLRRALSLTRQRNEQVWLSAARTLWTCPHSVRRERPVWEWAARDRDRC